MSNKSMKVLLALAVSGALAAGVLAQEMESAPQLRVAQMTGELQVTPPGEDEAGLGKKLLPFIRSGSVVRIVSGVAVFESDSHAIITGTDGDAFLFSATEESGPRRARMTVASVGPNSAISIQFSDKKFLLRRGGALSIASPAGGEAPVTILSGYVELMPGSVLHTGESLTVSLATRTEGGMAPSDSVSALVSKSRGFEMLPVDLASLTVDTRDTSTYVAKTIRPKVAAGRGRTASPDTVIAAWPEASRLMAELMMDKYGLPDSVGTQSLSWSDNGPWKRTIVHRNPAPQGTPKSRAILEQFINYDVPPGMATPLARMGVGLKVDDARKELSAVSGAEATNFLALNLADDVVTGQLSAAEAKASFRRAVSLAEAGKTSEAMKGLRFDPRRTGGAPY